MKKENETYQNKCLDLIERGKQDSILIADLKAKIQGFETILRDQDKEFKVDMKLIENLHHKNHCKDRDISDLNQMIYELKSENSKLKKDVEVTKTVYENKISLYASKLKETTDTISDIKFEREDYANKLAIETENSRMLKDALLKHKQALKQSNTNVRELERELEDLFTVNKYKIEKNRLVNDYRTDFYDLVDQKLRLQEDILYETTNEYS